MDERIKKLYKEVEEKNLQAKQAKEALESVISCCKHQYGPTQYVPIVYPAYTIPADPPGTMGSDWRPACYVPETTVDRWKRICENCGKAEYTVEVSEKVSKEPKW